MRLLLGWLLLLGWAGSLAADDVRHVVLISVDGLPAYLLDDPDVPLPAIRGLARQGTAAVGMKVTNPSVTWPNHTSLVTGVHSDGHGVLFNGVLVRRGPGLPVEVDPRRDKAELVAVPTLFDIAHAAGLSTAAINWPCTRNSRTIDDDFPDVPETFRHMTPRLKDDLLAAGILSDETIETFMRISPAARDKVWTDAACFVIRERRPRFLAFHLLNVDAVHHRYGPRTWAGSSAVAYADACVARVLEALDEAGIRDETAVFIVADHGFISIPKTLQPNVVLRQEGLLSVEGNRVTSARVHVVPEGGTAMVYLTVPETAEQDREAVRRLFQDREGIAEILEPEDYAAHDLPLPDDHRGMGDLVLSAQDGYGFSGTATGDEFVVASTTTVGTHGFLSKNPLMDAAFVAAGAGVKQGLRIERVENIDVAPTIARLLGLDLDDARGRVLEEILD